MKLDQRRYVELGSVVESLRWKVTPDKYEGPRAFADLSAAEAWAREKYGLINVLATMRGPGAEPLGELNFDEVDGSIEVGHQVLRTVFRLTQWFGMAVPVEYADPHTAAAAVPEGRTVNVTQMMWFGLPGTKGVQVYGASVEAVGGRLSEAGP